MLGLKSEKIKLSVARKAMLWWFRWPGNAYVSVSAVIDSTAIKGFLATINAQRPEGAPAVSVHHWVVGAVTRLMVEFPMANARIIGHDILRQAHVGVGMPVNLLNQKQPNQNGETTLTILERVEKMTLREIAGYSRRMVEAERTGRSEHALVRTLTAAAQRLPYPLFAAGLTALDILRRAPVVGPIGQRLMPLTTAVSNVGASLALPQGALLRGGAVELPQRLMHVGTLWGISSIQDEVFAIDGQPMVRPALPVIMIFDHRLIDGVLAGRMLVRLAEIARDPAQVFGEDGQHVIGAL